MLEPESSECDSREVKKKLREILGQEAKISTSPKTLWYNSLKTAQGKENYLRKIVDPKVRNCTIRFRFGSHWLRIKAGLWEGLKEKETRKNMPFMSE